MTGAKGLLAGHGEATGISMGLRTLLGLRRRSHDPLDEPDALGQIAQTRQNSKSLVRLRERLARTLAGQHCLIVGSAPAGATVTSHDKCICVNGSGWSAAKLGISRPNLTLIAGWSLRGDNKVNVATVEALRDLQTETLLFLESGCSTSEALRIFESANFRYDEFLQVNSLERAVIIGDICGEELAVGRGRLDLRPSNGIFAAALALWAGAKHVTLTGFSFKGGHAYIDGDTLRHHVEGDQWFLERTTGRPIEIV